MSKINLTDEQMQTVIDALNNETEVPPELLKKLSPSFFAKLAEDAKFDYEKLDSFKIPTIEYAGKRSEAQILNHAAISGGTAPLEVERCFSSGEKSGVDQANFSDDWQNLIIQGDNLQFLKTAYLNQDPLIKDQVKGEVKLIYIDPPFGTKSDFSGKNGESSYSDKVDRAEFLEGLRERLIFMRELLSDDGSIYVHLDQKMSHYVKILMDEIFGKDNFRNEIVWCYTSGGASKTSFASKHDQIFCYGKTGNTLFNTQYYRRYVLIQEGEEVGFDPNISYYKDEEGRSYRVNLALDWWTDIGIISPNSKTERLNYPNQKPEELLERIIESSSNLGDIVMDAFAGSGTTPAVAEKLGRRWIAADFGKHAIYTMQKRMLEISGSKAFGEDEDGEYGKAAEPFCVASVGAYDFSKVMNLREDKVVYTQFVCGLFNISDVDEELSSKYNLPNIYAEKDGDPVEVYPVWDDEYLSDIKVDEEYLESIITQSPRLSGTYYIISPESCSRVTSMVAMKNQSGGEVAFKILSFPYKVLEEFSRKQKIGEQPANEDNINNLISSVGFYFNENIEASFDLSDDGLKLVDFSTDALNADGEKFADRDGLAMILIDKDYDGDIFTSEEAVYAKDIDEDGSMDLEDLTDTVGVIAVDKHGNESEVIVLER